MLEIFSPYRDWLKLTSSRPNFYNLLGLQELETDRDAIDRAAAAVLAKVRKIQPGQQAATWVSLLKEIEQARDCLLDPVEREKYNATLQAVTSPQENSPVNATIVTVPSSEANNLLPKIADAIIVAKPNERGLAEASIAEPKPSLPSIRAPRGRTNRKSVFYNVVRLLFLSTVIAVGWYGYQNKETVLAWVQEKTAKSNTAPEIETKEQTNSRDRSAIESAPSKQTIPSTSKSAIPQASEKKPIKPVVPPTTSGGNNSASIEHPSASTITEEELAAQLKAKQKEFEKAQLAIIQLLRKKQTVKAKEGIEALEDTFTEEVFEEPIDALVLLHDGVDNFWESVKDRIAQLKAGQTMTLNGHTVVIVEASPKILIIRSFGKNHRFRVDSFPHGLALRFASQQLDKNAASTFVILGAYQYVSPDGSIKQAKAYWKLAMDKGFDATSLLNLPKKW